MNISTTILAAFFTTTQTLAYLQSLPFHTSHRVLSGQFIGYQGQEDYITFDRVYRVTKQYPAILSVDYADFGNGLFEFHPTNAYLINHWRSGGLVEVAVHFNNPVDLKWNLREINWSDLVHPGRELNTNLNIELDRIIIGLRELQSAGLVVLFRPFMEVNGDWFWWCEGSREEFVALWKYTHDYLTAQGIHNLLWV